MKKEKILQVRNFIVNILRRPKSQIEYLQITTISGNWEVRFPSYNSQFHLIKSMVEDDKLHVYLDNYITLLYLMCAEMPDIQFMEEFFNAHTAMSERMIEFHKKNSEPVSEEEDKEILEAERAKYEAGNKVADLQQKIDESESGEHLKL